MTEEPIEELFDDPVEGSPPPEPSVRMVRGVVYRTETGEVTKSLTAPETDIALNVGDGEAFLETDISSFAWVRDGEVVPIPPPPSHRHVFDPSLWEWLDPRSQQEIDSLAASEVRRERDGLLSRCDWTMAPDAPTDKSVWQTYRQALRDISEQQGFPHSVEWPTPPG